ncbi:MAG TPA: hypothetical protein VHD87_12505 [Acidimicrobiales bacterium]|nr:hypothetical protein [Acidimicrobiales bacterium]
MRTRVLVVLSLPFVSLLPFPARASAAPSDSADCAITQVSAVTGVDARGNEQVNGVATTVEGAVPPDIGRLVTEVVTQAMAAAEPIRTAVQPASDDVIVTVRGVSGYIPADLPVDLGQATGCVVQSASSSSEGSAGGNAATSAQRECAVTSVLPVDAAGEVTGVAGQVQGALVGVAGPLPVDLQATIAGVFGQLDGATSDLVVQVVDSVEGAQVTVEGVAGPLPADLSGQLASALGCKDTAAPVPVDSTPAPGSGNPSNGGGSSSGGSSSGSNGNTTVAGASLSASGSAHGDASSPLPLTGRNLFAFGAAGSVLVGVGLGLMRLRRLVP